jgi:hypothetical protein
MHRLLALIALSIGCAPPPPNLPPGKAMVQFMPASLAVENLTLTSAVMHLHDIRIIGDIAPPPTELIPNGELNLDVLSSGASLSFTGMPQGVYSRLQLAFDNVVIAGAWRNTSFMAHIAQFGGPRVDLRSADGRELGPGQDIVFVVPVDVPSWFANDLLDGASPMSGQIVCDDLNNPDITLEILTRVGQSFGL